MGGLFKKPEVPKVPKTKPMPDENDPLITLARRRRLATEMQTGGNMSTILTGGASRETLGGG